VSGRRPAQAPATNDTAAKGSTVMQLRRRQPWVRRDWVPSVAQLAQARRWIAEGRPVPAYWLAYLGEELRERRGAA
jgi:hypothetical protein